MIVWSKFELDIPKVIIDSNKELEKVMDCCISVLTHTVPEFCNMKREEGIKTRATIFEVLQNESIHMKTNCLIFFKKYFTSLVMINEVDTKFFIAIIETLSRIYKEIYSWFPEKRNLENLKTLHEAVHKFLESAPIEKFAFDNQLNVQNLIVYASEILYLQTSDAKEMWFDAMLVYSVIVMVKRVLDNFDYSLSSVERLSLLSNTSDSEIIPLMKYLVIAELEQAHNFQLQVAKTSRTWKKISDLLTIKIERLLSFPGDTFELELRTIADVVLLAYQIEFEFTIRHQFKHGMHPNTCMCNSLNSDTPVSPLMKFSGWDYKHINMEMFGDLEKFTQKLLDLVEVNGSIEASGVVCFIDIFSSVLMFSNSIRLLETVKQIFVTIVASPFYKCIKDDPQYKNHVGSSKVMASLPKKLQTYFDTDVPEHHLEQMRIDSILCLSMLEISAIGNPCWTLVENIIQFVTNQDGQKLKETLFSIIPNFIVKNGYKFAQIIDQYQEILNSKNGPIAIKPLQHILCLSGGNVTILKKSSSENHFHFFIVCENCKISTVPCFKEKKLEENLRRMALIKKNKGLLISSDCIKQGKKPLNFNAMKLFSQPDELKMEIYSKIPAVLNHSSQIQESIRADKGKSFFETIFSTNEKVLEKLSANLGDILSNIKSLNFGETTEAQIMNNCFTAFANILKNFAFGTDANQQHLMVSIAFTFVSIVPTEIFFVKCFKIFALFIVQQSSKVMDEASNMAQEMAKQNNITLELLLTWHRTFLMEHIVNMCITNLFQHKTSLLNSLTNVSFLIDKWG